ncbi:hypothetical protein EC844_11338 [Acinetobacter calcoaceticus]|uniref:tRNA 2-thiouridine synthesizing protein B n=1 Tax=Acinetobacter calcoaceticus TaxID=471 RepID=A0A4V2R0Y1_ACICA|nr:hypothetical protein EC844_11338 [Acinetobacter calcoaceticus]
MSNDKNLYLIQSDFNQTQIHLSKIDALYGLNDAIVLMGEACMHVDDQRLCNKANLYLLQHDAEILAQDVPSHVHVINYAAFADLILGYKRCISFH